MSSGKWRPFYLDLNVLIKSNGSLDCGYIRNGSILSTWENIDGFYNLFSFVYFRAVSRNGKVDVRRK